MSVLVKGMEMPKEGSWIELRVFPDGQCFLYSWCGNDFDFMEHLTAAPVPPHGDLIDQAVAVQVAMEWCPDDDGTVGKIGDLRELLDEIEALPTIIEAEE